MYKVVLDEKSSYIESVEAGGVSFEDAVGMILEYVRDCAYDLQEAFWESVLADGEEKYETCPIHVC